MRPATLEPALVDTNIVIYAHDSSNSIKQTVARDLLTELSRAGRMVLSAQILNEFYNASTRPHKPPSLPHKDAVAIRQDFVTCCDVLPQTAAVSLRAFDAIARYGMSLWDALIWAAAKEHGIAIIYSEDNQSASDIEGIRYINPFSAS